MADVIFIRHNMSSTDSILEELWANRLIAVHYHDAWSTKLDAYSQSGKTASSRLIKYCQSGVIVGADYLRIRPSSMLIGEIPAGSKIEDRLFKDISSGKEFIYKTVELKNSKEISFIDHPLLASIQPRQASLTGWPSATKYLISIFNNWPLPLSVTSLHPSQLGILCYEFMKDRNLLHKLLMPIGRGTLDVDICGIDKNGHKVFAQVTRSIASKTIEEKAERLSKYLSERTSLYLFAPEKVNYISASVKYIPIEYIFSEMLKKEANKIGIIKMMLGHIYINR